tara:strand:- start:91 stop:450 length:360 start_codon:yes stop_codon:yes gene_type:complete
MTQKLHNDLSLNALFNEAKSQNVDVPDRLMSAILADADGMQRTPIAPVVRSSWWYDLINQFGGRQAVAAFASFAVFGMYIGYAAPSQVLTGFGAISGEIALNEAGFSGATEFELSLLGE